MAIFDRIKVAVLARRASLVLCGAAYAKEGQPAPWQIGFQTGRLADHGADHRSFHTYVTIIITLIALFVLGLLVYVMSRFNEKRNPDPSRTTHNTPLEIAWTVLPVLILVAIAIPSFRLLFAQYDFPKPDLTITATGSQWYWTYEYPDHGITFDSHHGAGGRSERGPAAPAHRRPRGRRAGEQERGRQVSSPTT